MYVGGMDDIISVHKVLYLGHLKLFFRVCAHRGDTELVEVVKECTDISWYST